MMDDFQFKEYKRIIRGDPLPAAVFWLFFILVCDSKREGAKWFCLNFLDEQHKLKTYYFFFFFFLRV